MKTIPEYLRGLIVFASLILITTGWGILMGFELGSTKPWTVVPTAFSEIVFLYPITYWLFRWWFKDY